MSRRLDDTLLATGPLVAALAAAVHPLAGIAVAVALVVTLVASARRARRRRPANGAPVVVVAPLAPRRVLPRPEVSVGAIVAGSPAGVRALTADELGRARVRRAARAQHSLDAELMTACWSVATRRNARLTDAAAVRLGLADTPLPRITAPADPDPLLLAAVAA